MIEFIDDGRREAQIRAIFQPADGEAACVPVKVGELLCVLPSGMQTTVFVLQGGYFIKAVDPFNPAGHICAGPTTIVKVLMIFSEALLNRAIQSLHPKIRRWPDWYRLFFNRVWGREPPKPQSDIVCRMRNEMFARRRPSKGR
jgi:hypothetical protein